MEIERSTEIDKQLKRGHLRRACKLTDEAFIHPAVRTEENDKSLKSSEGQTPNAELNKLIEQVAKFSNGEEEATMIFTPFDTEPRNGNVL